MLIDHATKIVVRCDRAIHLTPKEYDLLMLFLSTKRRALTQKQVELALWPAGQHSLSSFSVLTHNFNKKLAHIYACIIGYRGINISMRQVRRLRGATRQEFAFVLTKGKSHGCKYL